jgi:Family of unknown function (DUF5947)
VSTRTERPAGSRLRRIARAAAEPPQPPVAVEERCELCGEPIPPEHRHLIDVDSRALLCACRACQILFDRREAGGSHYRLVPERRRHVEDFELDDATWAELRIPVEMAFFFHSTAAERVVAFYPSPMGATESLLELDAWQQLERANPVLESLEPDVEALLVNRARGARDHFVVPVDDPYRLVGLIRTEWRGLTGGQEVWQEIERFFAELTERAETVSRQGEEDRWPTSESASRT